MRRVFEIGLMAMLLCGQGAVGSSADESAASLTGGQIFEKMLDKYASLASYKDEGNIFTTIGSTTVATSFTTRLARPEFYRIEWDQRSRLPYGTEDSGTQGAWAHGSGDYVQTGTGLKRQYSRDVAFSDVASTTSGGVATVPRIFFGGQGIGAPDAMISLTRLADDKIGNIECYLVSGDTESGETNTFWVGKRDFLIHQIRTDVGPDTMQSAWTGVTKGRIKPPYKIYGFSSIQTYTNVVVNKQLSREDFVPSFPVFGQ